MQKVDHAGYKRHIIHENPQRFDEDGDLIEWDDGYYEREGSPTEENPFQGTELHCEFALTASVGAAADPAQCSLDN